MAAPQKRVLPIVEDRQFIVDTYPLFASLQRIVGEYEATLPLDDQVRGEQVVYYARISSWYRQEILKQLSTIQSNVGLNEEEKQSRLQHYSTMHSILSLTEILYFPQDGLGEGVVGEELLDWLNVVDRAPSNEEGTELSTLSTPWESPNFFPYLTKCLSRGHSSSLSALLELLISTHPNSTIQNISKSFLELYKQFPRSTLFKTEVEFRQALKMFKLSTKSSLSNIERLYEELETNSKGDMDPMEAQDYVQSFRTLFSILTLSTHSTPSSSSSLEVLAQECETWQEYLITYLIYFAPLSTRQDLTTILETVVLGGDNTAGFGIDSTLLEERVQERLFKGDITGLLKELVSSNGEGEGGGEAGEWLWLATHLLDLLSHLNLPAFDLPSYNMGDEEGGDTVLELGPRETFLLSYADSVLEKDKQGSLWRVCCEYWGECGKVGRSRIEELLGSQDIKLIDPEEEKDETTTMENGVMDVEGAEPIKKGKGKNIEEVLTVLGEYGMEEQVKKICQRYAKSLIEKKKYGKALAYCVRAGDSKQVTRIGYRILNEYVDQGQESFIAHVDSLPTSLLRPTSSDEDDEELDSLAAVNAYQFPLITFLSRYRDFLALYSLASQRAAASTQELTEEEAEEIWRMKRQSSELLILLLTSGMAPKGFWAIMLLDSVGLLETQPPLVSLSETYELLRVIEEITAPVELSNEDDDDDSTPIDIFGDLDMLGRLLEGQERSKKDSGNRTKRALDQLEVVRGALARRVSTSPTLPCRTK